MSSPDRSVVFEEHRPALLGLAYRMLGSRADAEDMVQEAYLRWRRAEGADVGSPRSYLFSIVARLCIDHRRAEQQRRETYIGPWLPEPVVSASSSTDRVELAESLSMAFLVLLESLSPTERAAYLLRQIFQFDYVEIAKILNLDAAHCRQLVSRAEKHILSRRPRFPANPEDQAALVDKFMHACTTGDLEELVEVLAEDAVLYSDGGGKALAARRPVLGSRDVGRFILGVLKKAAADVIVTPQYVNGQPAFVASLNGRVVNVLILDIVGGKVVNVYIVVNPDKLRPFNLPPSASEANLQ